MQSVWPLILFFIVGTAVGHGLSYWSDRLVRVWKHDDVGGWGGSTCPQCQSRFGVLARFPLIGWVVTAGICPQCGCRRSFVPVLTALGTGFLWAIFALAYLQFDCQMTPEVRPDPLGYYARIAYHLALICLLIVATVADFREYIIPDAVVLIGIAVGVCAATISGDLQIIHLWVDWNAPRVDLYGPTIPEWIRHHHHWHGLVWSVTGLLVGGSLTWFARWASSLVMRQETLGLGDVTLMAMIGSFIGWQPVVFVFLLAPFCGVFVGVAAKMMSNRPYVPYGPFLAAATLLLLLGWRWLWLFEASTAFSIRRLFGDVTSLAVLASAAAAALIILLSLLRLYRIIPGKQREAERLQ